MLEVGQASNVEFVTVPRSSARVNLALTIVGLRLGWRLSERSTQARYVLTALICSGIILPLLYL